MCVSYSADIAFEWWSRCTCPSATNRADAAVVGKLNDQQLSNAQKQQIAAILRKMLFEALDMKEKICSVTDRRHCPPSCTSCPRTSSSIWFVIA